MKNPHQKFIFWLATAIAGAAVLLLAFLLPDKQTPVGLLMLLVCVGVACMVFGGLFASSAWSKSRIRHDMLCNVGVIGRWRVHAGTWRQFVALNAGLKKSEIIAPNTIRVNGIEIIVSQQGIMMDGVVHSFNYSAKLLGEAVHWGGDWTISSVGLSGDQPCCLYFEVYRRREYGSAIRSALVVPVTLVAKTQAMAVLDYFQNMLDELNRPSSTQQVGQVF
jgi:hypothetical protein